MKKKGFTLIELLVVISIISLLSTIVLASVNSARQKAQIGAGQQLFSTIDQDLGGQAVIWWDFNECSGTYITDKSGSNNNSTLPSGVTWSTNTPLKQGCSILLNGGYIKITGYKDEPVGNKPITLTAWVKTIGLSGSNQVILCSGQDGGSPTAYGIYINSNGTFTSSFSSNNGIANGKTAVQPNQWYYVTGVYDGAKNSLYVNGQLENSIPYSSANLAPSLSSSEVSVGVWCNYTGGNNFSGNIDEVRILASGLTANAIGKLYAESKRDFLFAQK